MRSFASNSRCSVAASVAVNGTCSAARGGRQYTGSVVSHRAARLYRFDHKKYKQLEKAGFNFEL